MDAILRCIGRIADNMYSIIAGFAATILGYFLPVKDIVHLLILFFVLDVIFGFWAAHKLRGERFSVKIIWGHTMPRMLLSLVLVLGAFMWDSVYKMNFVETHKMVGWFISGVLLYSIAENGYHITKWSVFPKLGGLFRSKVKDQTGMDVSDNDSQEENKNEPAQ